MAKDSVILIAASSGMRGKLLLVGIAVTERIFAVTSRPGTTSSGRDEHPFRSKFQIGLDGDRSAMGGVSRVQHGLQDPPPCVDEPIVYLRKTYNLIKKSV